MIATDCDVSRLFLLFATIVTYHVWYRACKTLKKHEYTVNLRTILAEEKGHINPHLCELEDGWWCDICRHKLYVKLGTFF
jgi:hypothetical protein